MLPEHFWPRRSEKLATRTAVHGRPIRGFSTASARIRFYSRKLKYLGAIHDDFADLMGNDARLAQSLRSVGKSIQSRMSRFACESGSWLAARTGPLGNVGPYS
jgi:hypothetical protein